MLSGLAIKLYHDTGKIIIDPWNESQLNPNSYNLRLSDKLLKLQPNADAIVRVSDGSMYCAGIDIKNPHNVIEEKIPEDGYWLMPGAFVLGATMEYTEAHPPCVPTIDGRSSFGRLGLSIHETAGFGDCGFKGDWTLELKNDGPYALKLYAGVQICQISYSLVTEPVQLYNSAKYQGQRGPRASGIWRDFLPK